MHCFLIAAASVDGYIAEKVDQNSTDWTSPEDTKFFRARTKEAGVVVMGSKTFETVGRLMPGRLNIVCSRDSEYRLQNSEMVVEKFSLQTSTINNHNFYITQLSPKEIVEKVASLGYSELALCGGASIYTLFMNAGVVDTLYLTIEPVVFGTGVKLFGDTGIAEIARSWQLVEVKKLNEQGTVLLEYRKKL